MHKLIDLDGLNTARIFADATTSEPTIKLTLSAPAGFNSQGYYYPPESFILDSVDSVAALYALLGEVLRELEREDGSEETRP
jgi:hypothetical protein